MRYKNLEIIYAQCLRYRYEIICFFILTSNLILSFGGPIMADEIELVLGDKNVFATGFKVATSISAFLEAPFNIQLISIPNSILQSVVYLNKSYLVIRFFGFAKLLLVCFLLLKLIRDKKLALLFIFFISFGANHFNILVNRPELDILLSVVFFVYLQSENPRFMGIELIQNKRVLIVLYLLNISYLVSAHPKSIIYYPVMFIVLPKIIKGRLNQLILGILILVTVGFSWHQNLKHINEVGMLKNMADSYFIDVLKNKDDWPTKIKAIRTNYFDQASKLDSLELSKSPFSPMHEYYNKDNFAFAIYNLNVSFGYYVVFFLSLFALLTFEKNYVEKLIISGTFIFAALLANKNYYNINHILFMLSISLVLWIGRSDKYHELVRGVFVLFLVIWTFNTMVNYYLKHNELNYNIKKFNLMASDNCQIDKTKGIVFYDNVTFSYLPWGSRASNIAYLDYLNINEQKFYSEKFGYALLSDGENSRLNSLNFIDKTKLGNGLYCYSYKEGNPP